MSHQIKLQPSGHIFETNEGETILEAALRHKIPFPFGCQSGVCGTCLGDVISGSYYYPNGLPTGLPEQDHNKGKALFCAAVADSDMVLKVAEIPDVLVTQAKQLTTKIIELNRLAPDVMEMKLKLPDTVKMPYFAGQYIEIILSDSRRRAFSIANAPSDKMPQVIELHLRCLANGYFTPKVFNELKEQDILRIEGALGTFFIRETSDRPLLLIGGGTGFAPLKGMMEQLQRTSSKRNIYLYWGVRSKIDLYYLSLAEEWAKQSHIEFIPVLSEPKEEDNWKGKIGFVHEAVVHDFTDMSGFDVYMSGPPAMIDAGQKAFKLNNLDQNNLYCDAFNYSSDALNNIQKTT